MFPRIWILVRRDDALTPPPQNSLKINISLDLDIEVHLTARIKGDMFVSLLAAAMAAVEKYARSLTFDAVQLVCYKPIDCQYVRRY